MALPEGLVARSDQVLVAGVGGGARGEALVAGRQLRFTRSASQLSLFDGLYSSERNVLDFSLGATSVSCKMTQRDSQIRWLNLPLKPWTASCSLSAGSLHLVEAQGDARSLQRLRRGDLAWGPHRWVVRSVHTIEGSSLPVAEPIGYIVESSQGQAVAAVEMNGSTIRFFLPFDDAQAREASLEAMLALALFWR